MDALGTLAFRWLARGVDLVMPNYCLACAQRLPAIFPGLPLCTSCRGKLEAVDPRTSCRGCLRPLAPELESAPECAACRRSPPPFERALALWRYRPPLDAVLRAFKFHGLDFLGEPLADAAAARLVVPAGPRFDAVAPVPLAWPRRLARGYNQAERIARPLARRLGVPYAEALARRTLGRRQSDLPRRERPENVRGRYHVRRAGQVRGRAILLVDDIFTTGSTARAAAAALVAGGAASVVVLAAAWTPLDGVAGPLRRPPGGPDEAALGLP